MLRCAHGEVKAFNLAYKYEEEEEEQEPLVDRILDVVRDEDMFLERNNITGQLLLTPVEQVVMERVRKLFGPLNELDWEPEPPQQIAARKIQAIYRGYKGRSEFEMHQAAVSLMRLFQQAYN